MVQHIKSQNPNNGKKLLIWVFSILGVLLLSLLIWHFIFSIYEVKYVYKFDPSSLKVGEEYHVECIGLNSLGWEINYRDLHFEYKILAGKELIDQLNKLKRNILRIRFIKNGEVKIQLNSKYALNPTILILNTKS